MPVHNLVDRLFLCHNLLRRYELFGEKPEYSFAPAPDSTIRFESESEFARAVNGRMQEDVFPLLDEMMATIRAVHPKLYNAVLDKLK